jgi:hypothetical protein
MSHLSEEIDTAISQAVTGLRGFGYSWADIGRYDDLLATGRRKIIRDSGEQTWTYAGTGYTTSPGAQLAAASAARAPASTTSRPAPPHDHQPANRRRSDEPVKHKDEWLTVADILDDLGIHRRTWQRWRELGLTPEAIRLPNRELRIRRSVYNAWLADLEEVPAA